MNTPLGSQNAYPTTPEQPFQMITRVLSNVVDMQQNMISNFSNISSQVESLRVEMRSGLSDLRNEIQRGEDKHITNMREIHEKEVDRIMRLLENMSLKGNANETPVQQPKPAIDPVLYTQVQQLQTAQQQLASLVLRNSAGMIPGLPQSFAMSGPYIPPSVPVPAPPQQGFPIPSNTASIPVASPNATTTIPSPQKPIVPVSTAAQSPVITTPVSSTITPSTQESSKLLPVKKEVKESVESQDEQKSTSSQGKGAGFDWKQPEGSWNCQGCYANNPEKAAKCNCCGTGKDGAPADAFPSTTVCKPVVSKPGNFTFGQKPAETTTPNTTTPAAQFSFAKSPASNSTLGSTSTTPASMFGSGSPSPANTFGSTSASPAPTFGSVSSTPASTFGSAGTTTPVSTFGSVSTTPTANKFSFADAAKKAAEDDTKKPITFSFGQKAPLGQSPLATSTNAPTANASTFSFKPAAASGQKSLFGSSASSSPGSVLFGSVGSTTPSTATETSDKNLAEAKNIFGTKTMFGSNTGSGGSGAFSFSSMKNNIFEGASAEKAKEALGALKKSQPFGVKPAANDDDDGKGADEEYEPDVDFKPVIPLPDLVELKTGEEGEEVVFKERCKLYRYNRETKETAERGVGDMKVLRHPETGRFRCVMRRDQVHKLCANFRLTQKLIINEKANSPNVAMFTCKDFSENNDGEDEMFFVKFKTDEQRQAFMKAFNDGVAAAV